MFGRFLLFVAALTIPSTTFSKQLYRGPSAGDSGAYYVISSEKLKNGQIRILSSRVGKGAAYTDFTELKINCNSGKYYKLAGGSEDGNKQKPTRPLNDLSKRSKWVSPSPDSSKSDLVKYVCSKHK